KPTVMEFWTLAEDQWFQSGLTKEREFVSKRAEVARKNGLQGARPKQLENRGSENPSGSARATQPKAPSPNPSPNAAARRSADGFLYARVLDAADVNGNCQPCLIAGIGPGTPLLDAGHALE